MQILSSKSFDRVDLGDGQTIQVKRDYTYGEMADLIEALEGFQDGNTTAQTLRTAGRVCSLAVVGWEGIKEEDGADIPFSREAIDRMTMDALMAVAGRITASLNRKDDKKKEA